MQVLALVPKGRWSVFRDLLEVESLCSLAPETSVTESVDEFRAILRRRHDSLLVVLDPSLAEASSSRRNRASGSIVEALSRARVPAILWCTSTHCSLRAALRVSRGLAVGLEIDRVFDLVQLEAVLNGRLVAERSSGIIPAIRAQRVAALDLDLQSMVHAVYADPAAWAPERMERESGMSRRGLDGLLKRRLGMTAARMILDAKLVLARRLEGEGRLNRTEVARRCGFQEARGLREADRRAASDGYSTDNVPPQRGRDLDSSRLEASMRSDSTAPSAASNSGPCGRPDGELQELSRSRAP
jgi:AraC-like DNA-binding protein